ncbi:hypothetical protein SBA4_460012 [Candidatus Sulfopaludibacter sp. SbA4]|nr:hypothetical protein SBA4_460012 [Candidatus Sulfopaludibacter sp. SbA4]
MRRFAIGRLKGGSRQDCRAGDLYVKSLKRRSFPVFGFSDSYDMLIAIEEPKSELLQFESE